MECSPIRAKRPPLNKGGRTVQVRGVQNGTLPLEKSIKFGEWELPGYGDQYGTCGKWVYRGCLHSDRHLDSTLDSSTKPGMAYIRRYGLSCYRSVCPVCFQSWANKEALKMDYRLKGYKGRWRKVVHVSVSPPTSMYADPLNLNRKKAYEVLKNCGLEGGTLIFHPFRYDSIKEAWYVSPHYHALGFGWIKRTKWEREQSGWIVENHGIRKSVRWTAWYQLTHAGVKKGSHAITWFGSCSYNVLKLEKMPDPEPEICPYCGSTLKPILWLGEMPPPDLDVFFASLSDVCTRPHTFY